MLEWIPLDVDQVKDLIEKNESGKQVDNLEEFAFTEETLTPITQFDNVVGQDSLTRFDNKKKPNNKKRKNNYRRNKSKKPNPKRNGPK